VADSISWQRFYRIPLGARVPHPITLMKITSRCGTPRRPARGTIFEITLRLLGPLLLGLGLLALRGRVKR
jgi:hypothetical protein